MTGSSAKDCQLKPASTNSYTGVRQGSACCPQRPEPPSIRSEPSQSPQASANVAYQPVFLPLPGAWTYRIKPTLQAFRVNRLPASPPDNGCDVSGSSRRCGVTAVSAHEPPRRHHPITRVPLQPRRDPATPTGGSHRGVEISPDWAGRCRRLNRSRTARPGRAIRPTPCLPAGLGAA